MHSRYTFQGLKFQKLFCTHHKLKKTHYESSKYLEELRDDAAPHVRYLRPGQKFFERVRRYTFWKGSKKDGGIDSLFVRELETTQVFSFSSLLLKNWEANNHNTQI
jgi:hypothetical protein